jgi:hypothetical protein
MNIHLIFGFGLLLVIVNVIVTVTVFRSESYDLRQKLLQALVIWLVPIIGAALLWYTVREDTRHDFINSGDRGNEYLDSDYPDKIAGHSEHHGGSDIGD